MRETVDFQAFGRAVEPILRILSPEQALQIVNVQSDEQLQHRIEELAGKANEGELSEANSRNTAATRRQTSSSRY